MSLVLPVAHDFTCPWCWIGLHQVERLKHDYGLTIEWRSYELGPEGLESPPKPANAKPDPRRPIVPPRHVLAYAAEQMEIPTAPRPNRRVYTHAAHEAVEYAKTEGVEYELVKRIYEAHWLESEEIDDVSVLERLATGIVGNVGQMLAAIEERRFAERIIPFDEPAYDSGVFYVPTYFIGGDIFPEQTYKAIECAVRKELGLDRTSGVYPFLEFDEPENDRPYTYINMVSTIDGKTVSGGRDETVLDIGSDIDHATMRQIENASDAVMIGAGNLRATDKIWYPKQLTRIVVTGSGSLPERKQFFSEGRSIVATTEKGAQNAPKDTETIVCGESRLDLTELLKQLRNEHGIERLLVEGGSELNASLLKQDLVDELFLTIAPKIKLGRGVPTYAGGEPLPREAMLKFRLMTSRQVGDEIYVRYKRDQ